MADAEWDWGDVDPDDVAPPSLTVDIPVLTKVQRARLAELHAALADAVKDDSMAGGGAAEIRAEIEEIEASSMKPHTVRSIGYRAWQELIDKHPSDDRLKRWDPATFAPAAILACCDQFKTEKQIENAAGVLRAGDWRKLFAAVQLVNESDDPVPHVRGR